MPNIKKLLPSIFGGNKNTEKSAASATNGRLETDALPVLDDDSTNSNQQLASSNNTPTVSTELTESVVRELTDPNFNSMEVVPATTNTSQLVGATALGAPAHMATGGDTLNTMNVHNAQQQIVMQFSNANNLHFGSVYNINSNINASAASSSKSKTIDEPFSPTTEGSKRLTPRKTTSVVAMMQSNQEPNHRILDTVATHLGEGWKDVMRNLGLSNGQIEQAIIDHQMHGGIKEVIYQLLLQWIRDADDGVATLGRITTLLWETNQRDCVQRMKLVWKSEANRKESR